MAYTSLLRFGANVHIEMTRDVHRRICRLRTLLDDQEEGYLLETDGEKQNGFLYVLPSRQVHESYEEGKISSPHQKGDEKPKMEYEDWVQGCIQQATAWARSHAIQIANESILEGKYAQASETYHDVMDHFPPPPDGPLLQWNYYRCIAQMEGIDAAREGLLLWLHEALPIAGINVNGVILDPAKELLGEEIALDAAKNWLESSSPHDPAHKMAKRWIDKQAQDGIATLTWRFGSNNPLGTLHPLLIPLQNGDLMIVGGQEKDSSLSSRAAIWHAKNQTWTIISPLLCGLVDHMGISLDKSTVLVCGGRSETKKEYSSRVFLWDYAGDTWKELSSLGKERKRGSLLLQRNGQLLIMGGEDPLNSDTTIEIWDRRTDQWNTPESIGLCLPDISLESIHENLVVTGASMATSGYGALIWNIKNNKWSQPEELRGTGIDGIIRRHNDEFVVWSKKSGEIDVGIWSAKSKSLSWNCKGIELNVRSDLTNIYQYDEERFVLLYADAELNTQAQLINPTTGSISELPSLLDKKIPIEEISVVSILGGVFLVHPNGWAFL